MRPLALVMLSATIAAAVWIIQIPAVAQSIPTVTVTGVQPNHSSVRIFYNPVSGAKDYRVYDVANQNDVKYAGMAHYQSSVNATPQDVPATDIEWNGLTDSAPHTLIVQAVDAQGPAPVHNLYPFACCGPMSAIVPPAEMLGSNKGTTPDGKISTNGQGPYTNAPAVIAQSQPFIVQGQPSMTPLGAGTQKFLDTFDQSEASSVQKVSESPCAGDAFGNHGSSRWKIGNAWDIFIHSANFTDTMPFISGAHFMDMLFDGGDSAHGCGPNDTIYASLSMSPTQTIDMSAGGIAHLTMEVDAHQSFRRWLAFNLSPANDPIQNFNTSFGPAINNGNNALFFETKAIPFTVSTYTGSITPAQSTCGWNGELYIPTDKMWNGRGLDDRSRLDLFVSSTHYALFQDNALVCQGNISAPWFNQPLKVYFSHYLYHSDADIGDMRGFTLNGATFAYPLNSYWFNDPKNGTSASSNSANIAYPAGYGFPHSDERHWDNMGVEVVPATSDFSSFLASVKLADTQPPQFSSDPLPTATSTPVPTNIPQPTDTPVPTATATSTVQPTSTVIPTETPSPVPTGTSTPVPTQTAIPTTTVGIGPLTCALNIAADGSVTGSCVR